MFMMRSLVYCRRLAGSDTCGGDWRGNEASACRSMQRYPQVGASTLRQRKDRFGICSLSHISKVLPLHAAPARRTLGHARSPGHWRAERSSTRKTSVYRGKSFFRLSALCTLADPSLMKVKMKCATGV